MSLRQPVLFEDLTRRLARELKNSASVVDQEQIERYRRNPLAWMTDKLDVQRESLVWSENDGYRKHKWDGTPDPLKVVLDAMSSGERRIGVESGTGTGKTFLLMAIIFWFLACWRNSTVVTIAPKEKQLRLHVWKEIGRRWSLFKRLFPGADLTDLRLRMVPGSDTWAAHGFSVGVGADEESATKVQGFHDPDMLFIIEETPGVHPAIMNAVLNTSVDEHNVVMAVGNPDHQLDTLHTFCTKVPGAVHVRVSALDHPNVVMGKRVIPGACTRTSVREITARYGDGSPMQRSRVRGFSPAEATDAIVRLSWCFQARDRGEELIESLGFKTLEELLRPGLQLPDTFGDRSLALGVDVANSKDGDFAAIARGRGIVLCEVDSFPCPDSNELGRKVATEIKSKTISPDWVGVDGVGVGAGTVNELRSQGLIVQNIQGSASMVMYLPMLGSDQQFKNLRSQMWWLMREDLQHGRIAFPDDEELFQDLITPLWHTKGGKITLEPKEDLKKRLGRSPDKGDAAVIWNWVRQIRVGSSGGGAMIDL